MLVSIVRQIVGLCSRYAWMVVAAATVACGLVVAHVTAAATFVHVYHVPAAASCVLIVEPATGVESSVNVTESMLAGFDALRLYFTELTT